MIAAINDMMNHTFELDNMSLPVALVPAPVPAPAPAAAPDPTPVLVLASMLTSAYVTQFAPSPVAMFTAHGRKAAELSACCGPDRNKWLGPFSELSTPAYLTSEYPAYYGWDTADLGADPTTRERYREAEFIHARWAMFATLGCLTPGILAKFSGVQFDEPVGFQADAQISQEGGLNYFGNPSLIHAKSIPAILACQVLLMGAVEAYRANQAGPSSEGLDLLDG